MREIEKIYEDIIEMAGTAPRNALEEKLAELREAIDAANQERVTGQFAAELDVGNLAGKVIAAAEAEDLEEVVRLAKKLRVLVGE